MTSPVDFIHNRCLLPALFLGYVLIMSLPLNVDQLEYTDLKCQA